MKLQIEGLSFYARTPARRSPNYGNSHIWVLWTLTCREPALGGAAIALEVSGAATGRGDGGRPVV